MVSEKKKKKKKQAKLKRKYAYERDDDVKGERGGVIIFLHRGEVGPNVNIIFESNRVLFYYYYYR